MSHLSYSAPQELPILDEQRIAELEVAMGQSQLNNLLQMLAAEALNKPQIIWRLVQLGQSFAASMEGHALKGAALAVGALRLSECARAIEDIASVDHPDPLLGALSEVAHETLIALKERINRSATV